MNVKIHLFFIEKMQKMAFFTLKSVQKVAKILAI